MADIDTNSSVFTDVIEVKADAQAFAASLQRLGQIYEEFLSGLGDKGKSLYKVGSFSAAETEVTAIRKSVDELVSHVTLAIETLGSGVANSLGKTVEAVDATSAKQQDAHVKSYEQMVSQRQLSRDIDIEQSGQANHRLEELRRQLLAARDIETEREGLLNKFEAEWDASFQRQLKTSEKADAAAKQQDAHVKARANNLALVKDAQNLATEIEGGFNLQAEGIRKTELMYEGMFDKLRVQEDRLAAEKNSIQLAQRKLAEQIAIEQEGAQTAALENLRKQSLMYEEMFKGVEKKEAKLATSREKLRRDIDLGIQGAEDEHAAQQERQAQSLQAQLQGAVSKTEELRERLGLVNLNDNLPKKIDALKVKLEEVKAEAASVQDTLNRGTGTSSTASNEEAVAAQRKLNALLEQQITLTRELEVAQGKHTAQVNAGGKANQSFFAKFISGIPSSIAHLTRFMLVWTVLQGVIDAVTYTIGLPFKQVADGLELLKVQEQLASELAIPLQANVTYAESFADNLRIANEQAKNIIVQLKERSLASNIPFDQLNKVFTGLLSSGAASTVSSMKELVTLAEGFAVVLRTSGRGTLDLQSQISGISDLFSGKLTGNVNVFLDKLHITKSEWEKILAEGIKYGDLLQRLGPRFQEITGAAQQLESTQTAVTKKVEELFDRLGAEGSVELFDYITKFLREVVDFLDTNHDTILHFLRAMVGEFTNLLRSIEQLAQQDAVLIPLKIVMSNIALTVLSIETGLTHTIQLVKTFAAAVAVIGSQLDASGNSKPAVYATFEQALQDYTAAIESTKSNYGELIAAINGDPIPSSKRERKFTADPPQGRTSAIGQVKSDFSLEKDRLLRDVDEVKDKYAELQNAAMESVSAQAMSHREALELIKGYAASELNEIDTLEAGFLSLADSTKKAINGDKNSDSPSKSAAITSVTKEVEQAQNTIRNIYVASNKNISNLTKQANKEVLDIESEFFKAKLALREAAAQRESALIQEQVRNGELTSVQAFDAEAAVQAKLHAIRVEDIEKELSLYSLMSVKHQEITDALDKENAAYTARSGSNSETRIRLVYQESLAMQAFRDAERAQVLKAREVAALQTALILNPLQFYSAQQSELNKAKREELNILLQEKEVALDIARAKNEESAITRTLILDVNNLRISKAELLKETLQEISAQTSNPTFARILRKGALEDSVGQARSRFLAGGSGDSLVEDTRVTDELGKAFKSGGGPRDILNNLFGADLGKVFGKATGNIEKFGVAANIASESLKLMSNIVQTFKQGAAQGGVLGGVGAVATDVASITGSLGKKVSAQIEKIPIIGQFIGAIGPILSLVGSLFTAAAKKIAAEVKQSFKETLEGYSNGTATLAATVAELERQRQEAISRLSGKKGGKTELNNILPDFDAQIKALKKTQEDIISSFETQLLALQSQSDVLGEVSKKWADINKQVKDYIGAGGDAAKATAFLSLQLEDIQKGAAKDLAAGQREAIQDAIKLNDLLKQKADLTEDYNRKVFDLANADALERRATGSVSRGRQIADLKAEFDEKIAGIDSEISLQREVVLLEGEVFTIAGDIEELHRLDARLRIDEVNEQIAKWKDLKEVIASISKGPDGLFTGTGVFGRVTTNNIEINVTVVGSNSSPQEIGNAVSDSLSDEIARQDRLSLS